jgi:hypothetical protein
MFLLIITLISILCSYLIVTQLVRDRFLQTCLYLIYITWHLPLILSIVLPFDYFDISESKKILLVVFILLCVHFIVLGGVFAYRITFRRKPISKQVSDLNQSALASEPKFRRNKYIKFYLLVFYPLSILASVATAVDLLNRGFSLSFSSVYDNKAQSVDDFEGATSTPYSFLAGILSGSALCILYDAIQVKGKRLVLNLPLIFPVALLFIINFIRGGKFLMLPAILLILLKFTYIFKPSLTRSSIILGAVSVLIISIVVIHTSLRSSLDLGSEADTLFSFLGIRLKPSHPFAFIKNTGIFYLICGLLFLYFGVQYDMLSAITSTFKPGFAPLTSLTVPTLYSRLQSILGGSQLTGEILIDAQSGIADKYDVFPGVWGTAFMSLYLEGGWILMSLVVLAVAYLHFSLVYWYMTNENDTHVLWLICFYLVLILAIIRSPLENSTVVSLIIFVALRQGLAGKIKFG